MPLPLPRLDLRTFDQLEAEGRARIPRYAPEWTDHNLHDPGLTLLQLFAWLTEMNVYRLDRTPEAGYRAFLRLAGVELRPAQVAETALVFAQEPPGSVALPLPAGFQVGGAGVVPVFQTGKPLDVSPARLAAVTVASAASGSMVERTAENGTPGQLYQPYGPRPAAGDALVLGFDRPLAGTVGQPAQVSLYVWAGEAAADRETRRCLIAEWEAARALAAAACPTGVEPDLPDWRQHYSARTAWEYRTGADTWAPLEDVIDETRALTLGGPVRFTVPADHAAHEGRYELRCRLLDGQFGCPPQIDGLALNAVVARHAADVEAEELLGASDGRAGQVFSLLQAPVVAGSVRLRVLADGGEEIWGEVLFWDEVGPHDRAFVLTPEYGEVAFGDGRVGRVPEAGAEIRASYQVGGGLEGNVEAGHLTQPLTGGRNAALVPNWAAVQPVLRVAQPFPVSGGAPAETLTEAQGRALDELAARHRAVTLQDFEILARATPGVPVARARALADHHPALPCFPAPGNVTVVVVPDCPGPRPAPDPGFLRAVARYLERRRTLTTELHVVGPCYTPVAVHARLHAVPGADARRLSAQARQALDAFFHPLSGGPDGSGWPVGRDVYESEVMALLGALPGVAAVDQVGLQSEGDAEPRCGNLPICPDCLVASGQHQIRIVERSTLE